VALSAGVFEHTTMTSARVLGTRAHLTKVPVCAEAKDSNGGAEWIPYR